MRKLFVIPILLILLFTGCVSMTPKLNDMIPAEYPDNLHHSDKSIYVVQVLGGRESDPIFEGSKIDAFSFRNAMILSLKKAGIFGLSEDENNSDFALKALILAQDQPAFGFDMTVTLLVKYILTDNFTREEVWSKEIFASYTAKMGEAFAGANRLRKAIEGAVRTSLKLLVQELSALGL